MKKLYFLTILFLVACSYHEKNKINFYSKNIYDLNISDGKIFYFCSKQTDPQEPRRFLNIYLIQPSRVDLFFTRRKLRAEECAEWVKEIDRIYTSGKQFRIVGVEVKEEVYQDKELAAFLGMNEPIKVSSLSYFSRIVTEKGCVGHFGKECVAGYSEKLEFLSP